MPDLPAAAIEAAIEAIRNCGMLSIRMQESGAPAKLAKTTLDAAWPLIVHEREVAYNQGIHDGIHAERQRVLARLDECDDDRWDDRWGEVIHRVVSDIREFVEDDSSD